MKKCAAKKNDEPSGFSELSKRITVHRIGRLWGVYQDGRLFAKTESGQDAYALATECALLRRSRSVQCIQTGEVFSTINEAGKKYGIPIRSIRACLNGIQKTAGGLSWKEI